jgi:signal transduction histidine kinase
LLIRPRPFLTCLLLCLAPLLLLALINYWNTVRIAQMAQTQELKDDLALFSATVNGILDEESDQLAALAESETLQRYVAAGNPDVAPVTLTNGLSAPIEAPLAVVLNNRSSFSRVILYGRNRKPLFVAERNRDRRGLEGLTIRTKEFLPGLSQPDQQVWTSRATTVLSSIISNSSFGASQAYSVPVFAAGVIPEKPEGALVGELSVDFVLDRAASLLEARNRPEMESVLIVLDRSGRVLYHTNDALKHQPVETALPSFVPVSRLMLANQEGTGRFSSPTGQEYLVAFMPYTRINAVVAAGDNQSQALFAAKRAGLLGIFFSLAIGVIAAFVLMHVWQRQYRGYDRVTEGVTAIVKGELDRHIYVQSGDEARVIADNINLMTERLREQLAREGEARQFESFVRLSAMLTHDLKNAIEALSLIVGNMELHFDNERFRADTMKSLTLATEKLKALVARISNPITTLSGEHKRPLPVDLAGLVRRVVAIMVDPAHSKYQVELKLSGPVYALADAERIEKVIENLIINALEAMSEGDKLTIEAGAGDPGTVFLSVADTGCGISSQFIEHRLFRPFSTTKKNGVGLGLYTCREVVRANAGVIEVQSKEGVGTTFRVVLPSAPVESATRQR